MQRGTWVRILVLAFATMAMLFAIGWGLGYRQTLSELNRRGEAELALAADRLTGQMDRYRYLPFVLSDHPDVIASIATTDPAQTLKTNRLLQRMADASGALDIYVMNAEGTTIASSNWELERSFMGSNFAWRPYFQRAMQGGLGYYHAVGSTSGQRGFYFAYPVRDGGSAPVGAIVVKLDLERIEARWTSDKEVVFFVDNNDVVFMGNRASLILRRLNSNGAPYDPRQYSDVALPDVQVPLGRGQFGYRIWAGVGDPALPNHALWLQAPMPQVDMDVHVLLETTEAARQALLWGLLAAGAGGVFWLMASVLLQRRAALAVQLKIEASAKEQLEHEVANRTRELSDAIANLRLEVDERIAAEAALHALQGQLVQSEKLRALGEMSAGISHELNQPLTAIQSLAENAEILQQRGDSQAVGENISAITKLAARAGRILHNLRSVARKDIETPTSVDMQAVIDEVLRLLANRIADLRVEVTRSPIDGAIMVRGGRVRLEQVVLNLISNALDAMQAQDGPRKVTISLSRDGDNVRMELSDNGPGLRDPQKVFEPFYTTKPTGESLGLGLSIVYAIVQSFGGTIRAANDEGGGAVFTVELKSAKASEVAA